MIDDRGRRQVRGWVGIDGFARSMPADRCRYLLDLPDLQLDDHPAGYLDRVRQAYELAFPPRRVSG